jgi:hypothetical protein
VRFIATSSHGGLLISLAIILIYDSPCERSAQEVIGSDVRTPYVDCAPSRNELELLELSPSHKVERGRNHLR